MIPVALGLLLAVLAGLEVYGLTTAHLFQQEIWFSRGLVHFRFYAGGFLAVGLPLLLMAPSAFAGLLAAGALVASAILVGPLAVLSTAFFLLSSWTLGCRLLGARDRSAETNFCAMLGGIAVYVFVMTLTARLPVQYPVVWLVLLALPIVIQRRDRGWLKPWPILELPSVSERAAFALLVFILGTHWLMALKPETSADGMAMHLAVPANIAAHHAFTVQPSRLIWSVMPMGADFMYAVVYLLGGEAAARLFNFAMLLVIEGLLYGAVRQYLSRAASFLMLAAFASAPLVQLVTGELFVENMQAAMLLGMMVALWRYRDSGEANFGLLACALGGTAMGVKLQSLAFIVFAAPLAIWEARRRLPSWVALFLATALPTYMIAWWKTGNPTFPFLNRATEIVDYRFLEPLRPTTPFDLTFHTHRFYEGQDGSFSFHFLLLVPLAIFALAVLSRRSAAVVGLGAAIFLLYRVPNARYIYGALPLLLVASSGAIAWMAKVRPTYYRLALLLFLAATGFNIWFLPSSSYYHKDFYPADPLPVRMAARYFYAKHRADTPSLLFTGELDQADVAADAHANHWHDRALYDKIRETATLPEMLGLMQANGIRYFLAPERSGPDWMHPVVLADLLSRCTSPEYDYAGYTMLRLEPDCLLRPPPEPPVKVVHSGTYDDFDSALRFTGGWDHSQEFDGAYLHSISYSDTAAAAVTLAFEGRAVTYLFTRASNRGIAEISVDGTPRTNLDLYGSRIEWQSRRELCCYSPGRHVISIRVTGRKRAGAKGAFVDVDALVVR